MYYRENGKIISKIFVENEVPSGTSYARVVQLGERMTEDHRVAGSNPVSSTWSYLWWIRPKKQLM